MASKKSNLKTKVPNVKKSKELTIEEKKLVTLISCIIVDKTLRDSKEKNHVPEAH